MLAFKVIPQKWGCVMVIVLYWIMEMELRRCSVDSPLQVGMTHPLMMSTQTNWERIQLGGLHPNSLQVVWSHARRWSFVENFEETPMKEIWFYWSSSWCLRLWQVVLRKLAKEVRVQVSHWWANLQVSTIPIIQSSNLWDTYMSKNNSHTNQSYVKVALP